jgi:hypothetical protein
MAASLGGLSLTLPSGKDQLHGLIVTRLEVTVSLRRDSRVVWRGQATTVRASGREQANPRLLPQLCPMPSRRGFLGSCRDRCPCHKTHLDKRHSRSIYRWPPRQRSQLCDFLETRRHKWYSSGTSALQRSALASP